MKQTNDNYTKITQTNPSDNVTDIKPISDAMYDSTYIEEGEYEAVLTSWETSTMFMEPKLIMHFKIIEFGKHLDKQFSRFYYVKRLKGKPGNRGKFVAKSSGDLLEHWYELFPDSIKIRPDRVPLNNLLGKPVKIKVITVKKNYKGEKLPEQMYYSKVDKLLKN